MHTSRYAPWTCVPSLRRGRRSDVTTRTSCPHSHRPSTLVKVSALICRNPQQQLRLSTPLKTHSPKHPAPTTPPASSLRLYPTAPQIDRVSIHHLEVERVR